MHTPTKKIMPQHHRTFKLPRRELTDPNTCGITSAWTPATLVTKGSRKTLRVAATPYSMFASSSDNKMYSSRVIKLGSLKPHPLTHKLSSSQMMETFAWFRRKNAQSVFLSFELFQALKKMKTLTKCPKRSPVEPRPLDHPYNSKPLCPSGLQTCSWDPHALASCQADYPGRLNTTHPYLQYFMQALIFYNTHAPPALPCHAQQHHRR